jgi:enoyl-CoA hydratase
MTNEVLVDYSRKKLAVVRINRPDARNALSAAVRAGLAQVFADLEANDDVRCVVLTGSEIVFAAGADIKAMADASPSDMMNNGADAA